MTKEEFLKLDRKEQERQVEILATKRRSGTISKDDYILYNNYLIWFVSVDTSSAEYKEAEESIKTEDTNSSDSSSSSDSYSSSDSSSSSSSSSDGGGGF